MANASTKSRTSSPKRKSGARKSKKTERSGPVRFIGRIVRFFVVLVLGYLLACTVLLVSYRWIQPPATTVQVERMLSASLESRSFGYRYSPVDDDRQDTDVRHAVVASEDARFYSHRGFDFKEIRRAREDAVRRGRAPRGASTLTQQLVKNLFLSTHRSYIRKGLEIPLTLIAELVLPKERILTLYLNVAEWGPGVFGIEEAAAYHYGTSANALSRNQAARLAAVLPNPIERSPRNMGSTAARIERRMRELGW